jgi:hypothetical protein
LIDVGWPGGALIEIDIDWGVDDPQVLLATIERLPFTVPAIAVMELVVEVPDQPLGKVQVYEMASAAELTL